MTLESLDEAAYFFGRLIRPAETALIGPARAIGRVTRSVWATVSAAKRSRKRAIYSGRWILPSAHPNPNAASTLVYGFVSIVWRSHCSKFVAVRRVASTVCPMAALSISSMPPAILAASSKRFSSMMECSHFQREVRCASEVPTSTSLPKLACLTKWRPHHPKRRHIQPDTALGARSL